MGMTIKVTGELAISVKDPQVVNILPFYRYLQKGIPFVAIRPTPKLFYVPRNVKKLGSILRKLNLKATFVDEQLLSPVIEPIVLSEGFKLKPDQERCSKELQLLHKKREFSAVLEAPCGWGKTFQLAYYLWMVQQKTLILVDRTVLVTQMVEEIEGNTNIKVNVLSAKNKEVGDINIATLQFLMKNPEVLAALAVTVGSVVLDECHVAPAAKFCRVIGQLPAKYRLGLSATPTRSDGLTQVIHDVFTNNTIVGVNDGLSCSLVGVSRDEIFNIQSLDTYKADYDEFVTQPSISEDVTALLTEMVTQVGRIILLYTTSQVVQQHYFDLLTALGLRCVIVNAKTKKRTTIFKAVDNKEYDVIIAGNVLNKGVSIKRLDTCVNLSTLTKEDIEQVVGRLRRDHPEKRSPILIDFLFSGLLRRKTATRYYAYQNLVKKYSDKYQVKSVPSLMKSLKSRSKK